MRGTTAFAWTSTGRSTYVRPPTLGGPATCPGGSSAITIVPVDRILADDGEGEVAASDIGRRRNLPIVRALRRVWWIPTPPSAKVIGADAAVPRLPFRLGRVHWQAGSLLHLFAEGGAHLTADQSPEWRGSRPGRRRRG
jgi:hypothetical protein